jgi:hypothetical protein
VVETVSTPSLASSTKRKFLQVVPGPQTLTTPSQNQTQTQNIDLLYCETCNGIPFDRYQRMHLVLNESVHGFRRTLSLTRSMLYSVFGMDEDQINTTLCPAFFNTQQEAVSDGLAHSLRCGHGVLCAQMRPCASNCTDSATCFASDACSDLSWCSGDGQLQESQLATTVIAGLCKPGNSSTLTTISEKTILDTCTSDSAQTTSSARVEKGNSTTVGVDGPQ